MMFAIVLLLVAGVGTSLAPWYVLFLPLRFATALAIGGLMISSFVLSKCFAREFIVIFRILYVIYFGILEAPLHNT